MAYATLALTQTSAGPLYVIGQLVKKHTPSAATLKAIYRTGCRERSTTGRKISWNICRGMATSAIWKIT